MSSKRPNIGFWLMRTPTSLLLILVEALPFFLDRHPENEEASHMLTGAQKLLDRRLRK